MAVVYLTAMPVLLMLLLSTSVATMPKAKMQDRLATMLYRLMLRVMMHILPTPRLLTQATRKRMRVMELTVLAKTW
jgi:hypothetical protein